MGRLKNLAFALQIFVMLSACAENPTPPSTNKPSWHWELASGKAEGTSEQFARDRYACLQDYRQTASPFIQRDAVTELKFMTLHQEVCLEGKGWKQVQEGTPKTEANPISYWTASGWQTAPAGTQIEVQWIGPPPEPSGMQYQPDKEACQRVAGIQLPLSNPRTVTIQQGETVFACLWGKGWALLPAPKWKQAPIVENERSSPSGPWEKYQITPSKP